MFRRKAVRPQVRPLVPCGQDVGGGRAWVIESDDSRTDALETGRTRLVIAGLVFAMAFVVVAARLVTLGLVQGDEGQDLVAAAQAADTDWTPSRAPIVDRNGELLAVSLPGASIYANPHEIRDPEMAAQAIASVAPNLDLERLRSHLARDGSFIWVDRCISPRRTAAINALGLPGVYIKQDECRAYPQGALTSQVVGFTDIDGRGLEGMERSFDEVLRGRSKPLRLSIDLRLQTVLAEELGSTITEFSAIGGAGVIMDVRSGEVLSLVSLPTYDPLAPALSSEEARFNRATLGVYEMGSVFKIFSTALSLDSGAVSLRDGFNLSNPIRVGRFTISDFHMEHGWHAIPDIFRVSSNIGTVQMAMTAGTPTIQDYFGRFGLLRQPAFELPEVAQPLVPSPWRDINSMTAAYGHGIAVTPLQVARAVSAVVNGGEMLPATLLARGPGEDPLGQRVISKDTSDKLRWLMRLVVESGTGRSADAPGYLVGGKTGTADKLSPHGGYMRNKRIASFAGAFPMDDPRYVIFVMVDEPKPTAKTYGYATAGWVAAPMVRRVVERLAPIIGLPPRAPEPANRKDQNLIPVSMRGTDLAVR